MPSPAWSDLAIEFRVFSASLVIYKKNPSMIYGSKAVYLIVLMILPSLSFSLDFFQISSRIKLFSTALLNCKSVRLSFYEMKFLRSRMSVSEYFSGKLEYGPCGRPNGKKRLQKSVKVIRSSSWLLLSIKRRKAL